MFSNSLGDCLVSFWKNYIGWGRATRAEYWWAILFYAFIPGIILHQSVLAGVWLLITFIPFFCLSARRLHDTGRSNWYSCLSFIPIIGGIILLVFMCQHGNLKSNTWGAPRI